MLAEHGPKYIGKDFSYDGKLVLVTPKTDMKKLAKEYPWLEKTKLVVKPDQLFGKRGKHKLLLVDADWKKAQKWIKDRMNKKVKVGKVEGKLTHFLIEPFFPHKEEFYIAMKSERDGDVVYFSKEGGIYVEENWDKVIQIPVPILQTLTQAKFEKACAKVLNKTQMKLLAPFAVGLFKFYRQLNFAYLEINPFAVSGKNVVPLDFVGKLDDTGVFESGLLWGDVEFPVSFGMTYTKEEEYIKTLVEKSGSSLKLTILNPKGRVWTMVAGGGASVIYADTIVDLGSAKELANYGEYSGNPSTDETYEYAKTIMDLMTRGKPNPKGKFLLIGGGIANFTDVAKTFKGINMAFSDYADKLKKHNVKIYVRRGGPNYKEGLRNIEKHVKDLGLPIEVYGPETHMTKIVKWALEGKI